MPVPGSTGGTCATPASTPRGTAGNTADPCGGGAPGTGCKVSLETSPIGDVSSETLQPVPGAPPPQGSAVLPAVPRGVDAGVAQVPPVDPGTGIQGLDAELRGGLP